MCIRDRDRGVPLWFCLLLPLCIAGMKLFAAAVTLWDYEKRGFGYNENKMCIRDRCYRRIRLQRRFQGVAPKWIYPKIYFWGDFLYVYIAGGYNGTY